MTKKWAWILILDVFMGLLTGAFALFLSATITALGIESLFLAFVITLGMTFLFSLAVQNHDGATDITMTHANLTIQRLSN